MADPSLTEKALTKVIPGIFKAFSGSPPAKPTAAPVPGPSKLSTKETMMAAAIGSATGASPGGPAPTGIKKTPTGELQIKKGF